jgi:hypothetical protein
MSTLEASAVVVDASAVAVLRETQKIEDTKGSNYKCGKKKRRVVFICLTVFGVAIAVAGCVVLPAAFESRQRTAL